MEEENKEKKESIEEILFDLNNLLNKMPSILSDIKIPEPNPVEFLKTEKEEAQLNANTESVAEAKQVETRQEIEMPEEKVVAKPAEEYLVESYDTAKIPADNAVGVTSEEQIPDKEPGFVADESALQTVEDKEKIEIDKQNIKELAAALSLEEHQEKLENLYNQTKSFSVPDIDALFKIAEEPIPRDAGDSVKESYQEKTESGVGVTAGVEGQNQEPAEVNTQGGKMNSDENPKDEDISHGQNKEEPQEKPKEEISDEGFEFEKTMKLEDLKEMESVFQEISPQSQAAEPQTGQSADDIQETAAPIKEESAVNLEQPVEPAGDEVKLQPDAGFTEEQPALESQPLQTSAEPGEEKTLMIEPLEIQKEPTLESRTPPSTEPGEEKTVVFEPGSIQFGQATPIPTDSEGQVRGQEVSHDFGDKTIMVSEEALTTSRSRQSVDLSSLVTREPSTEIPPERIKSVGFLYSMEEEKMCAELLQEIDSICSKSKTKPMFVKRAFVKVFEPDIKGNYILEVVSQTQGMGLVCVGNIPQENIYEVENVFNSSNVFFRHINQENFNHASVVNLIADLIVL